jgi:hypothetical protein
LPVCLDIRIQFQTERTWPRQESAWRLVTSESVTNSTQISTIEICTPKR